MKTMDDLREFLFGALADLRDGKIDTTTAKAVSDLSQTVINTAKAEADFARATGREVSSGLIPAESIAPTTHRIPTANGEKVIDGNRTRHVLK